MYIFRKKKINPDDVKIKKINADKLTDKELKQICRLEGQSKKLHIDWDKNLGLQMNKPDGELTRKWINERQFSYIAVDPDGDILGYVCGGKESFYKNTVWLADLVVDEDARGLGLGKRLLREALKDMKSHGFKNVLLNVSLQNKPALGLYEKTGFKPWEYTMVKNL